MPVRGRARARLVVIIAAALLCGAFAGSARADGPSTWTINYVGGGFPDTATISKHSKSLTGTVVFTFFTGTCPGTLSGTQTQGGAVQFTVTAESPCSGQATYSGRVDDETQTAAGSVTFNLSTPDGPISGQFFWNATISGGS
jgi:hypothetical protein